MGTQKQPEPAVVVIFGAEVDLTQRKLVPALVSLYRQQALPESFSLIGVDRAALSDDVWRQHPRAGVGRFGGGGPVAAADGDGFAHGATYL